MSSYIRYPNPPPCQDNGLKYHPGAYGSRLAVRLSADLSAAAFRSKVTNELCLWYALRSINQPLGNGWISLSKAKERLIQDFNFSPTTLDRLLSRSNGKFIELLYNNRRSTIRFCSLAKVVRWFGIAQVTQRHWREVPVDKFNGVAKRHSQLYASIFHPLGVKANPITRETITEMTGLSKMQQRRYDSLAHIRRVSGAVVYEKDGPLGGREYIPVKMEVFTKAKGARSINRRAPNIYYTQQQPSSKGMLGKVRSVKSSESLVSGEAHHFIRSYFLSFRRLLQSLMRRTRIDEVGFYLTHPSKRIIKGRLEWCYVSRI